ncbi:MAG: RIP metalloprotease RseP [Pseudomonadales bacterium]
MDSLQTIVIAVLTFGVLVTFHEFGHFWVARRCGVKVIRFSIGFGPALLRWNDSTGTEYVLAAIPLGGFVRMLDEREGEVPEDQLEMAFNGKSLGARAAIVAAGPVANFALAILAYWIVFASGITGVAPIVGEVIEGSPAEYAGLEAGQEIISLGGVSTPSWRLLSQQLLQYLGESADTPIVTRYPDSNIDYESRLILNDWLLGDTDPDLLKGLGVKPWRVKVEPRLALITDGSPAQKAGLMPGDLLLQVDGELLAQWQQWVDYVQQRPEVSINILVEREGSTFSTQIVPEKVEQDDGKIIGRVGTQVVAPKLPADMIRHTRYGIVGGLGQAVKETWNMSVFTVVSIKKLLAGLISPKNLSGPITIAKVASASAKMGLESYLTVLALLSISLGVLNLLPIPVLDGGHLLFYAVEWVKGSPLSEKAQALGFRIGLSLVLCLMVFAIYNDVSRL